MTDGLSRVVLRVFRVPPEPRLPAGAPESARVFRAGANYWKLKLLGWGARQALTLAGFVFLAVMLSTAVASVKAGKGPAALVLGKGPPGLVLGAPMALLQSIEILAFGVWLLQLPVTFAIARLDYELRWYIVTDRAARLREGIVTLKEMTFTLANVQDIRLRQGPLQRLLGLADVELRTAGGTEAPAGGGAQGGHASENLHLARFRGVENAEAIRDLVIDRMKKARGAGLGDPDDAPLAAQAPVAKGLEAAARGLAEESARLRAALSR